ncbi:MAG: hypothetical protein IT537_03180 [Hyphomicrobiales bacterium]|nr:hypothetical protein [Hyphomicrobiales bacterium]
MIRRAIFLFLLAGLVGGYTAVPGSRLTLQDSPTFYVAPTGADAPLQVCADPATPCATIQHVRNALYAGYDLAMQMVTIQLMDGVHPPICNAGGCGPHMQHWNGLLGQTSPDQLRIVGNCGDIDAVVLRQAPPVGGAPVGQAAFDVSGSGAFTLRCVVLDGQGANQDQIAANGGGSIVLDRVTFRNATSVTNAANNISCDGTTIAITGQLVFDGGNPQAGIYASKGCSVYLNANNIGGLLGFDFVNAPNYSLAAFIWASSNAALNLQGLGTTGAISGRFAIVKGNSTIDLGVSRLVDMPGTLPSIDDGATGGHILEDANGALRLWSIPAGLVSGTTRSNRLECWGIVAPTGALGTNTGCNIRTQGAGSVNYQNGAGGMFAQDSPVNGTANCFGYIQRVGNSGGPPYLAAQSNCPGVTQEGFDFNLLGGEKAFRFIARSPTQFLAALGVGGLDLMVPLKINGAAGLTASKTVYGLNGWCTLAFTSGILTGGTC